MFCLFSFTYHNQRLPADLTENRVAFFLNSHDWFPLSALLWLWQKLIQLKTMEEWMQRAKESNRRHSKKTEEAFIHGRRERKAASLTDPESHIRFWWSWHVQACGRKDRGGKMEVWEWIMLWFSQKPKASQQAGIGSQWSLAMWGNGSKINCVCLRLSLSMRADSGGPCVQVCHLSRLMIYALRWGCCIFLFSLPVSHLIRQSIVGSIFCHAYVRH